MAWRGTFSLISKTTPSRCFSPRMRTFSTWLLPRDCRASVTRSTVSAKRTSLTRSKWKAHVTPANSATQSWIFRSRSRHPRSVDTHPSKEKVETKAVAALTHTVSISRVAPSRAASRTLVLITPNRMPDLPSGEPTHPRLPTLTRLGRIESSTS